MSSLIGGSMKRIHLLVLLSLLALPLAAEPASGSGSGSIVVGELYASGGNSGALYANVGAEPRRVAQLVLTLSRS
jgi:hypothetical protein